MSRSIAGVPRRRHGNVLILIIAIVFVIVTIALFAIGYVRIFGSSSEQKTAIEAAALAAARDMSKIVIEDPDFGFVGLSDAAPTGSLTTAADNFYTSVYSINTLIGTARLDYLIASQADLVAAAPEWKILAKQDLEKAKVAASKLITKLKNAIKPGGTAVDRNGVPVKPHASALAAYKANGIRMTGSSNYVEESLKLELGIAKDLVTNVSVPQPETADGTLDNNNTAGGFYKAYVNMPLAGVNFVFAGIGDAIRIVNPDRWQTTDPDLPYQFPTIVKAEAQQKVNTDAHGSHVLSSVACAQPASVYNPRPAPGALTLSFPDGVPDGAEAIQKPLDLYSGFLQESSDTSNFLAATSGDYPVTSGSQLSDSSTSWPLSSTDPDILAGSVCKLAIYDWIRRAGTKANIDSIVGMHYTQFIPQGANVSWPPPPDTASGSIPCGVAHVYRFDTDGVIYYESAEIKPSKYWVISDKQNFVECFTAIKNGASKFEVKPVDLTIIPAIPPLIPAVEIKAGIAEFTPIYDMYARIYSRRYGSLGGRHRGEPMDNDFDDLLSSAHQSNGRGGFVSGNAVFSGYGAEKNSSVPPLPPVGIGALPTISPQGDFAFRWQFPINLLGPDVDRAGGKYRKFNEGGSGMRSTYEEDGSVADIRFRRLIRGRDLLSTVFGTKGYVGKK